MNRQHLWRTMIISRFLALVFTTAIAIAVTALQLSLSIQVGQRIADYELTGLPVHNDLGQRGNVIGGVVMLVVWALAGLATWNLLRGSASGFLFHSVLWLVLLPVLAFRPLPDLSEPIYQSLQTLCLIGAGSGIAVALTALTLRRRRRVTNSLAAR